jgi:hypothetical protein
MGKRNNHYLRTDELEAELGRYHARIHMAHDALLPLLHAVGAQCIPPDELSAYEERMMALSSQMIYLADRFPVRALRFVYRGTEIDMLWNAIESLCTFCVSAPGIHESTLYAIFSSRTILGERLRTLKDRENNHSATPRRRGAGVVDV